MLSEEYTNTNGDNMANREFLLLAQVYVPGKHNIKNWFASEKLDGMRAFWDGGITRGLMTNEIPWANPTQTERATGLWSRYGHPIHAPGWWLDLLPTGIALDGELWTARGEFQTIMSIVRRDVADERWNRVKFKTFDSPSLDIFGSSGKINNPNFKLNIDGNKCRDFIAKHNIKTRAMFFEHAISALNKLTQNEVLRVHAQRKIRDNDHLEEMLSEVTDKGGEGLILRDPMSTWDCKRSRFLLKVKRMQDTEGTVVGYTWGEGKYEGMLGSLIISWNGKFLNLSGMTDAERVLVSTSGGKPGTVVDPKIQSVIFPRGSKITFRYRELSDDGIPKEARYLRKSI